MTQTISADLGAPKIFPLGRAGGGEGAYLIHGYCAVAFRHAEANGLVQMHGDIDVFFEGGRLDLGAVQGQVIPLGARLVADVSITATWLAADHYRLHLDYLTELQDDTVGIVAYQVFVQTKLPE